MNGHSDPDLAAEATRVERHSLGGQSILLVLGPDLPHLQLRRPQEEPPTPVNLPESPETPPRPPPNSRYQLLGEIARGGMGVILKGRDADLGRDIAVKVLLEAHKGKPELVRRFVEEAQIAGQLQHPGVTPVYELGVLADDRPYFTMKLVKGQTLARLLHGRKDPHQDLPRFLAIFEHVCQAVAYAHARGVIHRDLKPANIMVGSFGESQVMDWGLAKVLAQGGTTDDAEAGRQRSPPEVSAIRTLRSAGPDTPEGASEQTRAGSVMGTPAYMAPEQAAGDVDRVDERGDVFGLGAILCEVLTGQPPYTGKDGAEVFGKAVRADLADAHARLDGCGADAELVSLAKRCLTPELAGRPRDAGLVCLLVTNYRHSVAERLQRAELAEAEARARAEEERKRRRLTLALAAAVLLLVLAGGAGWWRVRQDQEARAAETASQVHRALGETASLRNRAMMAAGDLNVWLDAEAAAKRADALADSDDADPATRQQARRVLEEVTAATARVRERVAQAEKGRRLLAELEDIRTYAGDRLVGSNQDFAAAERRYAEAFRRFGADPDVLTPDEAAGRFAGQTDAARVELAAALDDWAYARRVTGQTKDARRSTALARRLDPDPLRTRVRDAIDRGDALALRELAGTPEVVAGPPQTLNLAAVALGFSGDFEAAVVLLRAAQRRHPGDFQINHNLGWFLNHAVRPPRPEEALPFVTAAAAIRPASAAARLELVHCHSLRGKPAEAMALLQDLTRAQPDNAWLKSILAELYLRRWADAVASLARAAELQSAEARWSLLAAALLEAGDVAGYRRLCGLLLTRFGSTRDPTAAAHVAQAGLLAPEQGGDLNPWAALADLAATKGGGTPDFPFCALARALAAYRTGDAAGAIEWSGRCRQANAAGAKSPPVEVAAFLVEALAQQQLGKTDQATQLLAQATRIEQTALAPRQTAAAVPFPDDWLFCLPLRREAERVLRGHNTQ